MTGVIFYTAGKAYLNLRLNICAPTPKLQVNLFHFEIVIYCVVNRNYVTDLFVKV